MYHLGLQYSKKKPFKLQNKVWLTLTPDKARRLNFRYLFTADFDCGGAVTFLNKLAVRHIDYGKDVLAGNSMQSKDVILYCYWLLAYGNPCGQEQQKMMYEEGVIAVTAS